MGSRRGCGLEKTFPRDKVGPKKGRGLRNSPREMG
jgi:hypothetical protein